MNLPKIVENDKNFLCMEIGPITLWYSYSTLIAFQVNSNDKVVHENVWSNTTGRHLNRIDCNHEYRHNSVKFNDLWRKQTKDLMVSGLFA